jgi:hypothetical protein
VVFVTMPGTPVCVCVCMRVKNVVICMYLMRVVFVTMPGTPLRVNVYACVVCVCHARGVGHHTCFCILEYAHAYMYMCTSHTSTHIHISEYAYSLYT